MPMLHCPKVLKASPSTRREWIEIVCLCDLSHVPWSPSTRREWIEIKIGRFIIALFQSPSTRREWIEMYLGLCLCAVSGSPSTRREWIETALWRGVSPSGVPSFLKQLLFATVFHARKRWQNHIPSILSATLQTTFPYIPSICNRRISSAASSTSYTYSFGTPVSAVSSTRDGYFLW